MNNRNKTIFQENKKVSPVELIKTSFVSQYPPNNFSVKASVKYI